MSYPIRQAATIRSALVSDLSDKLIGAFLQDESKIQRSGCVVYHRHSITVHIYSLCLAEWVSIDLDFTCKFWFLSPDQGGAVLHEVQYDLRSTKTSFYQANKLRKSRTND